MPVLSAPPQPDSPGLTPAAAPEAAGGPASLFREPVCRRLDRLRTGRLTLRDQHGERSFGAAPAGDGAEQAGRIDVRRQRFYRRVALGGSLGAAESYLDGDWDSPDLTAALTVLARNMDALQRVESGPPRLLMPLRALANALRDNTRRGSRRNIAAHYDLSNAFFALMLDPTMTYSSGVFPAADSTLEEASRHKYDLACRALDLGPNDHVLEIGAGWGGFAEHAARRYGCRVTTTTISAEQHDYAQRRFERAGLTDRVRLLRADYRDLDGVYDKLVSIEMIEAVGERHLPGYFARCGGLLAPGGRMLLQAITIPDARYASYRRSVDFIQRYIFPGGFLPSPGAIAELSARAGLRVEQVEPFGRHYARTLAAWRGNLWSRLDDVRRLGFDDRFLRLWRYYLCYCEAGFLADQIDVSQWVFTKPAAAGNN